MALLYRPLAFYRETCVFPPVVLEKPMEILEPFLVYVITSVRPTNTPILVEIGSQWAPPHSGEISRFCDFCSPFFSFYIYFFSVSSSRLQVAIFNRFARFIAQTTCSVSYTCHFGVWSLQIHFLGVSGPKNMKISTRFWTPPICWGNRFSIKALKSKLPWNVEITPQKLYFLLEVTNQEFLSHTGGSAGSVFFKMAAAAILNFEELLPFRYYWNNPHQIQWECWEFDLKRNCRIKIAYSTKIKKAAATILNSENLLPFLYYWTKFHQIWW